MKENTIEVEVSPEELAYLKRLASNQGSFDSLFISRLAMRGGKFTARLDRTEAEQLRASLTELLAKFGFERDYSLTNDGQMLEDLIDRFYMP